MDQIISYLIAGGQARAYVAQTTELTAKAMRIHGMSHVATAALGRTMTCAAIMGVQMKNREDRMSVTIKGDGPLGMITVAARSDGSVKGCVQNPFEELMLRPDGKLNVGGAVGMGRMTVVKDLGMKDPYVGTVALQSGEIAEDFAYYFAVSEQQPCAVALGVLLDHGKVRASGGVILQPMPGCSEEVLRFLEHTAPLIADVSSLFNGNTAEEVGKLLFAPIAYERLETYYPRYRCDCERARIQRLLVGLGKKELADMLEKQHGAQVTCQFCNKVYDFDASELEQLMAQAKDI